MENVLVTYNIIYDHTTPLQIIVNQLSTMGVQINNVFENLAVMNITADNTEFNSLPFVIAYEEDNVVIAAPSFEWHQYRIANRTLPMREQYITKNKGAGASIYLVDSGVDTSHPEYINANVINVYSYDGTFGDPTGHGTGVGSIIVGNTLGVSPEATLKVIKIALGTTITLGQLLEAFNAILADNTESVSVINCAWTIPKSQILDTKILEMQENGFVVVAAAGNQLLSADDFSPVGLDSVLGVGASDAFDRVISWGEGRGSNWGPEVDITAPGIGVFVAVQGGGIAEASGTSIAAGIISGIVAQAIVLFPDKSANEIEDAVLLLATPDALFRDESIYETTPNLLAMAFIQTDFINNFPDTRTIDCKKNEITNVFIDINTNFVTYIELPHLTSGTFSTRMNPPWVSLQENNTLAIQPDLSVNSACYRLIVNLYGENDTIIQKLQLNLNVYEISPDENNTQELYVYEQTMDSEIIVRQAFCENQCSVNVCFKTGKAPGGVFCSCFNTFTCLTLD
jgi:hypothetical protein